MGATVVYVTHDQLEALTLSDNVVVLYEGKVQQIADPVTLYDFPANLFVSNFVGTLPVNLVEATVIAAAPDGVHLAVDADHSELTVGPVASVHQGDKVVAAIRPEDIAIEELSEANKSADSAEAFEIDEVQCVGSTFTVKVKRNGMELTIEAGKEKKRYLQYGAKILVRTLSDRIRLYDRTSGELIGRS